MNRAQARANLQLIEATLAVVAGAAVEITIRGPREFTWHIPSGDQDAQQRLVAFARQDPRNKVEAVHDPEIGSFVYVDAIRAADERQV